MITTYTLFYVIFPLSHCFSYATKELYLLILGILHVIIGVSSTTAVRRSLPRTMFRERKFLIIREFAQHTNVC